jgi:putative DNA methylase
MFKIDTITKDWKEAGAFMAQVNLYGFWDEHAFLTKSGDLGCALKIGAMSWDFPEVNPFARAAGDFAETTQSMAKTIASLPANVRAKVQQRDATTVEKQEVLFSSDPPYYDNIGYADLSDFFYVWLRRSLHEIYPQLMSTLLVPKKQELIATPYRFDGGKEEAKKFFEDGFGKAMRQIRANQEPDYPVTIYYAFKQSESEGDEEEKNSTITTASTGWETMLAGLLSAGFQVTGTWPVRSERPTGVKSAVNALASSIVLVCRPRPEDAPLTTRKDFLGTLKRELGPAIRTLQQGNIAPVDLQQAAIGPGMGIFSRYSRVMESDGKPMGVRTALGLINAALDEVLSEQESDYDRETRWALVWFEERMYDTGDYGRAEVLANAKGVSVRGVEEAGILSSHGGKVRLLERKELDPQWDPTMDNRITVWEVTQHLIHRLDQKGQDAAAELVSRVGGLAETARELAYRLYTLCERKGWAEEAGYYNALVVAWPAIRGREFTLTGER